MAGGRPLKFETVLDLETKIQAYFADCDPHMEEITEWIEARSKDGKKLKDENGLDYLVEVTHKVVTKQKPYTFTGLANALNTTRDTLLDYEGRDEFSDSIKKARSKCEEYVEQSLFSTTNVTGVIFNLKNNYGWVDKSEQDLKVQTVQPLLGGNTKDYIEGESTKTKTLLGDNDGV